MNAKIKLLFPLYWFIVTNTLAERFDITEKIFKFSITTFQNVNKTNENFILSPLATQILLAFAYDGASGETAQVLNTGLDLTNQTKQDVIHDFNIVTTWLISVNGNNTLNIANKIYLSDIFNISPAYQADASKFLSSVDTINFTNNGNAASEINTWASLNTAGNVVDVVEASDFNDQTEMVLINVVYFNGFWKHPFSIPQTQNSTFYPTATTSQQIEMMNIQNNFNYGYISQLSAKALQMQYTDPTLSMLFLLPNRRDGLSTMVSEGLGRVSMNSILNHMTPAEVMVRIPKFTIDADITLNSVLQKMGMDLIFESTANFSNMVTQIPTGANLSVSSVIQKAVIEVDEGRANIGNATVLKNILNPTIGMPGRSGNNAFIADHPFLMILLKGKNVVFIGCFVQGYGSVTNVASQQGTISMSSPSYTSSDIGAYY